MAKKPNEQYELQVLLELREQARDDAQDEVARQVSELEARKRLVREKQQELSDAIAKRERLRREYDERAAASDDLVGGHLYNVTNYLRGLRQDEVGLEEAIVLAEREVVTQQEQVERARQALIEAATELEAVLSHYEAWSQEQRLLSDRKQSAAMDDIAARIWSKNKP